MGKTSTVLASLLCFSGFLFSGCLDAPLPMEDAQLSAVFIIPEKETYEGVEVILPGTTYRGFTDREGKVVFDRLPPRSYEILARAEGFEDYRDTSIVLEPGDHVYLGQIELTPLPTHGTIVGRVVVEGLEGAPVEVRLDRSNTVIESATDGRFEFRKVPPGSHDVAFYHPGYAADAPVSVTVEAGTTILLGTITLKNLENQRGPEGTVTGLVLFEDGTPAAGVEIVLPGTLIYGETEIDGTFRFDNVESGTHTILFEKEGFRSHRISAFEVTPATVNVVPQFSLQEAPLGSSSAAVQVVKSGADEPVDPNAPGIVTGWAFYPDREDHSGIKVRILDPPQEVTTDAGGAFLLPDLPPGLYTVRAEAEGYLADELIGVEVRPGDVSRLPRMQLAIGPPSVDPDAQASRIVGQVLLEDQGAQPGTSLNLEGTAFVAITDRNGWFVFDQVPPGDYVLLANRDDYESFAQAIEVPGGEGVSIPTITLKPVAVFLEILDTSPGEEDRGVEVSDRVTVEIRFNERLLARTIEREIRVEPRVETRVQVPEVDLVRIELLRDGNPRVEFETTYMVTVGAGIESVDGHHLETPYYLRFKTGGPRILGTIPADDSDRVILTETQPIVFMVNEPIDLRELKQKISIKPRTGQIPSISSQRAPYGARIDIQMQLMPNREYTVSIPRTVHTVSRKRYENTPYRLRFRSGSLDDLPNAADRVRQIFDNSLDR